MPARSGRRSAHQQNGATAVGAVSTQGVYPQNTTPLAAFVTACGPKPASTDREDFDLPQVRAPRHELRAGVDPELVRDLLFGPFVHD